MAHRPPSPRDEQQLPRCPPPWETVLPGCLSACSASGGRAVRWAGPPWAQMPRKRRVHAWQPRGVHRSASASLLCLPHLQTGSNTAQRRAQHSACPEPARASPCAHRCRHCSLSEPDPQASCTPQGPGCRWSGSWAHTASRPPAARGTAGPGPRDLPGLPPRAVSARKRQDLPGGGALVHLLLCRGPL